MLFRSRRAGHPVEDAGGTTPTGGNAAEAAGVAETDENVVDPELQAAFESAFEPKPLRDPDADSGVDADSTNAADSDDRNPTEEPDDETLWEPSPAAESPPNSGSDTADEAAEPDDIDFEAEFNSDAEFDGEETAVDDFASMGAGEGLTDEQYLSVITALNDSPSAVDVDAEEWTPATLQTYLSESYGIDSSREECVELLRSAGHDVDEK